jgi:hypothetical protein
MFDSNIAIAKKRSSMTELVSRLRPLWHLVEGCLAEDVSLAMFVIGASPYRSPHKSDKDRFEIRTIKLQSQL